MAFCGTDNKIAKRLTCEDGETSGLLNELTVGWQNAGLLFFEAQGFYSSMDSKQDGLLDSTLPIQVGWYSIDGTQGPIGLSNSDDMNTHTTRDVKNYGVRLVLGWNIPLNEQ